MVSSQVRADAASRLLARDHCEASPELFKPHCYTYRAHKLHLTTNDQDRVKRAWQYSYSHGCTGKQSPFKPMDQKSERVR